MPISVFQNGNIFDSSAEFRTNILDGFIEAIDIAKTVK